MGISDDDLLPVSESRYVWRWTSERHDLLPANLLATFHAVRSAGARRVHDEWLTADRATRAAPHLTIDTEAATREAVGAWLESLPEPESERVVVSWSPEDAVVVPWLTFIRHWDAFCYPSSDDVTICPEGGEWLLAYEHSGLYAWRSLRGAG